MRNKTLKSFNVTNVPNDIYETKKKKHKKFNKMNCPYCEEELEWHDYYGYLASHQSGKKIGDIFKCINEDCEMFDSHFYTDEFGNLHEGYPC